jgi:DNA invertase Pin-like site-specific DNA recombinase
LTYARHPWLGLRGLADLYRNAVYYVWLLAFIRSVEDGVAMKPKRAAVYMRVSTSEQTTDNQARELQAAAVARGWSVVQTYADEAVSGAKGRDKRPQLDAMLRDAVRRRFDVVMVWAVDRLGRSLPDLVNTMQELHGAKVDLFIHQQALDTTTPADRAMFGMLGVFAEFERAMIQSRVKAGLERARAAGVKLGRPRVATSVEDAIRARLATGEGVLKVAKQLGVGTSTVQRLKGVRRVGLDS